MTMRSSALSDTSEIEGYGYMHQNSSRVIGLGLWGEMTDDGSTYSLTAFNEDYSPSNTFPMNYGDSWIETSYGTGEINYIVTMDYEYWDTSYYEIDAWGQIILPIGTFDALRVKKRHHRHQISDHFLFGFDKFEREFGWQWYCYEVGFAGSWMGPKDTLDNLPDSTFTIGKLSYQIANSMLSISEKEAKPAKVEILTYPNPFNSSISILTDDNADISIFDLNGKCILRNSLPSGVFRWQPKGDLTSGIYIIEIESHNGRIQKQVFYIG